MIKRFGKKEDGGESGERQTAPARAVRGYRIHNNTEGILAVQYFDKQGKIAYLNLRIQGRGGQVPPTLPPEAITDQMRDLQKKRIIRLEVVK